MLRSTVLSFIVLLGVASWFAWPRAGAAITNGVTAPDVAGENWLNSRPLTIAGLRGRVVLVEFWTYG
jgi:hypothetical protein